MENQNERTPWEWLGEIADAVIRKKQSLHSRQDYSGIVHAGHRDFEEAFEIPLKIYREKIRYELQEEYNRKMNSAVKEIPNFGVDAMKTLSVLKDLYFELARRDNPDTR